MRAGELRHQVTVQRYTETQNDFGEVVKGWFDLFTTRANVRPITGKEIALDYTIVNKLTHRVFLRYRANIKPNDRVIYKDRELNITSVINIDESDVSIELLCEEIY